MCLLNELAQETNSCIADVRLMKSRLVFSAIFGHLA
jgi:hypothetical protein